MVLKNRPSLDEVYLTMCNILARRSTCIRRDVAAILVDKDGWVISMGHNGVPKGVGHCTDNPCPGAVQPTGNAFSCLASHAEINCILGAAGRLREAATIYISIAP